MYFEYDESEDEDQRKQIAQLIQKKRDELEEEFMREQRMKKKVNLDP